MADRWKPAVPAIPHLIVYQAAVGRCRSHNQQQNNSAAEAETFCGTRSGLIIPTALLCIEVHAYSNASSTWVLIQQPLLPNCIIIQIGSKCHAKLGLPCTICITLRFRCAATNRYCAHKLTMSLLC